MKKIVLMLLTFVLTLGLSGCSFLDPVDPVIDSLPDYKSEAFYSSGVFQDFTDYAKYSYDSITPKDFDDSKYFNVTTAEDIKEILLHIKNFEEWVELADDELKENYDFDKTLVSEGDFFYIETKAGEPIGIDQETYGKFDDYTVYYFDIDTQTLYYFHNNI